MYKTTIPSRSIFTTLLLSLSLCIRFGLAGDTLYVWNEDHLLSQTSTAREQLTTYCQTHNIDTLFINAASFRNDTHEKAWTDLLTYLHSNNMSVEALLGDARWIMQNSGANKVALNYLTNVMAFQKKYIEHREQIFDGIHLDVEIESCPGKESTKVDWYIAFADQVNTLRDHQGFTRETLPINWDIGMHYDQRGYAAIEKTIDGVSKPGWQHIFDRLDYITFMSYNDRPRHIAAGLQPELQYMQNMPTSPHFRFAFEFQSRWHGRSLKSISLANEDYQTYLNLRQYIGSIPTCKTNLHCDGFALHYYDHVKKDEVSNWCERNEENYHEKIAFIPYNEAPIEIPWNASEPITDPVYIQLNLKANPCYTPQSSFQRGALSFLPVGYGYCSEEKLERIWGYDGLMPTDWFYYGCKNDVRWWESFWDDTWSDLSDSGVCWHNPTWITDQPDMGVVRHIVLQQGQAYRFLLAYNDVAGIEQFVSKDLVAKKWQGLGDSRSNPIIMTMYLGSIDNLMYPEEPHTNNSLVIFDNDNDGLTDNYEIVYGTDPLCEDSDADGLTDGDEVYLYGSHPAICDRNIEELIRQANRQVVAK